MVDFFIIAVDDKTKLRTKIHDSETERAAHGFETRYYWIGSFVRGAVGKFKAVYVNRNIQRAFLPSAFRGRGREVFDDTIHLCSVLDGKVNFINKTVLSSEKSRRTIFIADYDYGNGTETS